MKHKKKTTIKQQQSIKRYKHEQSNITNNKHINTWQIDNGKWRHRKIKKWNKIKANIKQQQLIQRNKQWKKLKHTK